MMGTTGVRIFNNMLSAAGQFSGIISVLTAHLPNGFPQASKMGAAFNQWAHLQKAKRLLSRLSNILNRIYR